MNNAPFFMDMITIYFALLPFLIFLSIKLVINGKEKEHIITQMMIFALTLVFVLWFEYSVRFVSGYSDFLLHTNVNKTFLTSFLFVHILIAVITFISWFYLLIKSAKAYKNKTDFRFHKPLAIKVTIGIFTTSLMGVLIYIMLFLY